MKTQFIRLLNYDNAVKVINFVNNNQKGDYANIVPGGISIRAFDNSWTEIEDFIKSIGVRYEISSQHPTKTVKQIVTDLKLK
jgi:hypothetical protein